MIPFVVGAYAALPAEPDEAHRYFALLADATWVAGLEIPYPGTALTQISSLATSTVVGSFSTLTLIPGTMGCLATNPLFGLASPDPLARQAALGWCREAFVAVERAHESAGHSFVRYIQLHSAPTQHADSSAFAASIDVLRKFAPEGTQLVIEHCDAWTEEFPVEKGFLSLAEEIEVARQTEVGIHLNWGRSVKETHRAEHALASVVATREADVLAGLMFSGIADADTVFGPAWADAHTPAQSDEPASLMTAEQIALCAAAATDPARAGRPAHYLGAKVQSFPHQSPNARFILARNIARAAGVQ